LTFNRFDELDRFDQSTYGGYRRFIRNPYWNPYGRWRKEGKIVVFKFKSIQIFPLAYSTENSGVIPVSVEYYSQGIGLWKNCRGRIGWRRIDPGRADSEPSVIVLKRSINFKHKFQKVQKFLRKPNAYVMVLSLVF
jgi:hypothetical protein